MSERSMGSEFDRKRVDGNGEQRRQQNEQSNQAGGQQGSSGGSLGAGPMTSARDAGMEGNEGNDAPVERGGTANRPGDANGSGSMGSTRRDDPPRAPRR